jgi:hypothetical protein
MAKFSELGVESEVVVGKGIDIDEIFDKRILIEKAIIQPTKFPGKNQSGLRMQMQVVLATFLENGEYVKRADGTPDGERRSCFTGSDILIGSIQRAETNMPTINQQRKEKRLEALSLYPMDTIIVKVGKCFQFT